MKKRLISPDFLKGICISLMVYGHVTHIGSMNIQLTQITTFIYTFHMPIFLIISGFFFSFSENIKAKIIVLIRRIGVPYLVFITLYLFGLIFAEHIGLPTNNKAPDSSYAFIIRVLGGAGAYWFLHSLFLIQLSLLFCHFIMPVNKNRDIFFTLALSLSLLVFLDLLHLVSIRTSIYFLIGVIIGHISNKNLDIAIFPAFLGTVFILLINSYDYDSIYKYKIFFEISWCLLLFSLLWSVADKFKETLFINLIAWVGRNSLIILVLHALFINLMKPLNNTFLNLDPTGISYSIAVSFSTIMLCLLSSYVFDKINLSRVIFGTPQLYSRFASRVLFPK